MNEVESAEVASVSMSDTYVCQMCGETVELLGQSYHIEAKHLGAVTVERNDRTSVIVKRDGIRIGYACRIRGIIHYTADGSKETMVIESTGSGYEALVSAL